MSKMRAVQVSRPGGPFEIVEREIPPPGAGLVRIRVHACGICHSEPNSLRADTRLHHVVQGAVFQDSDRQDTGGLESGERSSPSTAAIPWMATAGRSSGPSSSH
jgi:hypothetical protein